MMMIIQYFCQDERKAIIKCKNCLERSLSATNKKPYCMACELFLK